MQIIISHFNAAVNKKREERGGGEGKKSCNICMPRFNVIK